MAQRVVRECKRRGGGGDRLLVKKVAKKLPTFGLGTNWSSQCPFYLD